MKEQITESIDTKKPSGVVQDSSVIINHEALGTSHDGRALDHKILPSQPSFISMSRNDQSAFVNSRQNLLDD